MLASNEVDYCQQARRRSRLSQHRDLSDRAALQVVREGRQAARCGKIGKQG